MKPKGVTTQMKLLSMSISNSGERVLVKLILAFAKKAQKKILRRDYNTIQYNTIQYNTFILRGHYT